MYSTEAYTRNSARISDISAYQKKSIKERILLFSHKNAKKSQIVFGTLYHVYETAKREITMQHIQLIEIMCQKSFQLRKLLMFQKYISSMEKFVKAELLTWGL